MFKHLTLSLALLAACSVKDDRLDCLTTVSDVPLQRNRTTILTGSLYSPNASASCLQVNNSYLPSQTVPF